MFSNIFYRYQTKIHRVHEITKWHDSSGVLIISYEMFRNLSMVEEPNDISKRLKGALIEPGPDLGICDEGHLLKNKKADRSKAISRIKTLRRIALTGTPMQNNLKECECFVTTRFALLTNCIFNFCVL